MPQIMLKNWVDVAVLSLEKCPAGIITDLKYAGSENFLGRPVAGYYAGAADICVMTREAGLALCRVQTHLNNNYGLGLIVYDAYRPRRAVRDFNHWVNQPRSGKTELARKKIHYPNLEKSQLASLGYITSTAKRKLTISRHSYGNVVDASLVSLSTKKELNMGAVFDYFDKRAAPTAGAEEIGKEAFKNRNILIRAMSQVGFKVDKMEYWHFDYKKRQVQRPADFEITPSLRGLNADKIQN